MFNYCGFRRLKKKMFKKYKTKDIQNGKTLLWESRDFYKIASVSTFYKSN